MNLSPRLQALESEAIHIIRDGYAEAENPVVLFSAGKDSTVLAHLVAAAFYPAPPPLPLLHIDSTWEFTELLDFRDRFAERHGFELRVYANEDGRRQGLNPFDHGDLYTTMMRTEALKAALDLGDYDVIFGGARRDEEASRAKERIVSVRGEGHVWEPRRQRPELWSIYNWSRAQGQTLRAFPISNWTEEDLWFYITAKNIELAPLYYAAPRQVVERDGALFVVDDPSRMRFHEGETMRTVRARFRSLGCWPVTAASLSEASNNAEIAFETLTAAFSERQGRVSDTGSLEKQKRDGYF
ncbi:MAG: sulfate adenylyltransferase subunit CysD [Parvularcula sp.]|jgi:sulfate adenylyltransferase subunit 2|nr:sulfate adenylyltransferase subunit CysD [Parvularcula sp.]